jgi:hypothetical protein
MKMFLRFQNTVATAAEAYANQTIDPIQPVQRMKDGSPSLDLLCQRLVTYPKD